MCSIPKISIQDVDNQSSVYIDVRSPSEFREYHLPNAYNFPLFTDEERIIVGTKYKQLGIEEAKLQGLRFISPKLPELYKQIKAINDHNQNKKIIVYCWRGGMRSRSIVLVLNMLGIPCYQLEGGIRSYRKLIIKDLASACYEDKEWIVLAGNTGTGKTMFLHQLQEEGYPVIDLERLANHRGSVFGHIGLAGRSQKQFEALLWERLQQIKHSPYYIVEAESKRIGCVVLPNFIMEGKQKGTHILLTANLKLRIEHILNMYKPELYQNEIEEAINKLNKRLTAGDVQLILQALEEKNFELVLELLIKHYYDPRYEYSAANYQLTANHVHIEDWSEGYQQVKNYIDKIVCSFKKGGI